MTEKVIVVKDLAKSYDGFAAVNGISFEVYENEVFGIIGPNGAGKTSTVECLEGLRAPSGGSIRVLGLDPLHCNVKMTA
ncbi:ATP-binding cassette domain-containing protein [Peptococcaceae bacterium]|nr:ATP-binding cassette domain-containing protein [Peptococcaceae bacterium]MCL0100816.1 ATP-binding cassette domain-containing protein [Peptococcaceae bacterium]